MSTDLLNYHPAPRTPAFVAPVGAVDAHCHVFGPAAEFPFAGERKYTPNDAGKAALFALRDHLGFSRNVIVQASCHGKDNAAMVDALASAGELARGVAVVDKSISVTELQSMDRAGVRAVRFNFVKRLVDTTPWADFLAIAAKIEPLGWHIVVYFEAPDLAELTPLLQQFTLFLPSSSFSSSSSSSSFFSSSTLLLFFPSSLETALLYSPPAETRLTVYRRLQVVLTRC